MTTISISELEAQSAELLPEKETLAFNNNWASIYASNSSLALNAMAFGSTATSSAFQTIAVTQG